MTSLISWLTLWSRWMQINEEKTGYPKKSLVLSCGGASSVDAFEIMADESDLKVLEEIDAIIDSLLKSQKQAIYANYLKEQQPDNYEHEFEMAMDNILTIATRRGLV
jgi:hypothetical protein